MIIQIAIAAFMAYVDVKSLCLQNKDWINIIPFLNNRSPKIWNVNVEKLLHFYAVEMIHETGSIRFTIIRDVQ